MKHTFLKTLGFLLTVDLMGLGASRPGTCQVVTLPGSYTVNTSQYGFALTNTATRCWLIGPLTGWKNVNASLNEGDTNGRTGTFTTSHSPLFGSVSNSTT